MAGTGGIAQAFTRQTMTADAHRAYANACSGIADPYHQQLAQEMAAELGGTMSPAEIDSAIAAMRCPICGCSLTAAAKPE